MNTLKSNTNEVRPPTDAEQPKIPWRIGMGLVVGGLLWIAPYIGINTVLLPAKVVEIAPDSKETVIASLATVAMIVATLANIIIGAFSDLTRSRFGRRTPWLFVGSFGTAIMTILLFYCENVSSLILTWSGYQVFLNSLVAPLLAVISDRIAPKNRGSISALYAVGFTVGMAFGQTISAQFISNLHVGFWVLAVLVLLSAPGAAILIREPSSLGLEKKKFSKEMVLTNFVFPTKNCRDYYLALFGKLFVLAATFAITAYQLYILTDYIKVDENQAGSLITKMSLIAMVAALVFAVICGPLSDKLGKRKVIVFMSSIIIALAMLFPFFFAEPWAMLAYALIASGIGLGSFNAVDQALNIEVLPNVKSAAKDLGVLNLAQSGSQIVGPLAASAVINLLGYKAIFPCAIILAVVGAFMILSIKKVK